MKFFIIALRDIKANQHEPPMFVANTNVAIRDLRDMVNEKDGQRPWQRHPEDFELWELGEWDNETGSFYVEHDGSGYDRKQLCALSTLKD